MSELSVPKSPRGGQVRRVRQLLIERSAHHLSLADVASRIDTLVPVFYAGMIPLALILIERMRKHLPSDPQWYLWPAAWLEWFPLESACAVIFVAAPIGLLTAAVFPRSRLARVTAVVTFLQLHALSNSYGKINHSEHMALWTMVALVFLPAMREWTSARASRLHRAEVFWFAQTMILFFYSMAGLWKIVGWGYQFLSGKNHLLEFDSLARHTAARVMQTDLDPAFADWLIRHHEIGWVMMLGSVYLEFASVLIAFRPRLHRFWGASLIGMHLGIGWGMGIWFMPTFWVVGALFLLSPFQHADDPFLSRRAILDLPGVPLTRTLWRLVSRPAPTTSS